MARISPRAARSECGFYAKVSRLIYPQASNLLVKRVVFTAYIKSTSPRSNKYFFCLLFGESSIRIKIHSDIIESKFSIFVFRQCQQARIIIVTVSSRGLTLKNYIVCIFNPYLFHELFLSISNFSTVIDIFLNLSYPSPTQIQEKTKRNTTIIRTVLVKQLSVSFDCASPKRVALAPIAAISLKQSAQEPIAIIPLPPYCFTSIVFKNIYKRKKIFRLYFVDFGPENAKY